MPKLKHLWIASALALLSSAAHASCPIPAATTDAPHVKTISTKADDGTQVFIVPIFQGSNVVWNAMRLNADCKARPLPVEAWDGEKLISQVGEDASLNCYDIKIENGTLHCSNTGTAEYSLEYDYRVTKDVLQLLKQTTTLKDTGKSTIEYRRKS